jgi:transcription initiation factor TFIID subunit 10
MAANPPTEKAEHAAAPTAGPNGTQPTNEAVDANATAPVPPLPESRLPTQKDASLKEFLNKMDDYAPIVRQHYRGRMPSHIIC